MTVAEPPARRSATATRAVICIVRPGDAEACVRLAASLARFGAGAEHVRYAAFVGFTDDAERRAAGAALAALDVNPLTLPAADAVSRTYATIAAAIDAERLCFIDAAGEVRAANWLAKLDRYLDEPIVGLVGTSASFAIAEFPHVGRASIGPGAFVLRRSLVLELADEAAVAESRWDVAVERYRERLTTAVLERGSTALVVGRDGRGYAPERWFDSDTYLCGTQRNLLVHDARSRAYEQAPWAQRVRQAAQNRGAERRTHASPAPPLRARYQAAATACRLSEWCDRPVRLADELAWMEPAFGHVGVNVDASSDIVVVSTRSAFATLEALAPTWRVCVIVEPGDESALSERAVQCGFVLRGAAALECFAVVARRTRRVTPEYWRRIFAWLEAAPALCDAVAYADALASRLLPADAGARAVLIFERAAEAPAPPRAAPLSGQDPFDVDTALANAGIDVAAATAELALLLAADPRAAVIAYFVAATLGSATFDALAARLLPAATLDAFAHWRKIDAVNHDITEIARTWYRLLVPPDVLRYRNLDLGFTLETGVVFELMESLYFRTGRQIE